MLKLAKSNDLLVLLNGLQETEFLPFPSCINALLVSFLDGAYTYLISFWGHEYQLRVSGKAQMKLPDLLTVLKYVHDCADEVPRYAFQRTMKANLRFLANFYNEYGGLRVETVQDVFKWLPRCAPYSSFRHIMVRGFSDGSSREKGRVKISLCNYSSKRVW